MSYRRVPLRVSLTSRSLIVAAILTTSYCVLQPPAINAAPPAIAIALGRSALTQITEFLFEKGLQGLWDFGAKLIKPKCLRDGIERAAQANEAVDPQVAEILRDLSNQITENTSRGEYLEAALQSIKRIKSRIDVLDESTRQRLDAVNLRLDRIEDCVDKNRELLGVHSERLLDLELRISDVEKRVDNMPQSRETRKPTPYSQPDRFAWDCADFMRDYRYAAGTHRVLIRNPFTSEVSSLRFNISNSGHLRWAAKVWLEDEVRLVLKQGGQTVYDLHFSSCLECLD